MTKPTTLGWDSLLGVSVSKEKCLKQRSIFVILLLLIWRRDSDSRWEVVRFEDLCHFSSWLHCVV